MVPLAPGSKKTAVAATPGKTKHFQTLIVSEALLLCDCPGLVLPRYAQSKAEMVAAGTTGRRPQRHELLTHVTGGSSTSNESPVHTQDKCQPQLLNAW